MKNTIALLCMFCILGSCKKENTIEETQIVLSSQYVSLHYDETHAVKAVVTPKPLDLIWLSNDENVAKVSQGGIVKGVSVGETQVIVKTIDAESKFLVSIEPYSTLYKEPFINFERDYAYIKQRESRTKVYDDLGYELAYEDSDPDVIGIVYLFGDKSVLSSVGVFLYDNENVVNELEVFLRERHGFYGFIDGILYCQNENALVMAGRNDTGFLVLYVPPATQKSSIKMTTLFNAIKSNDSIIKFQK